MCKNVKIDFAVDILTFLRFDTIRAILKRLSCKTTEPTSPVFSAENSLSVKKR
jgi:hypothetical protein